MVKAALIARLARLEAKKAQEEGTRFFLCFAGDADAVIDDLGRRWDREAGETVKVFHERTRADRPFGFITLNQAATA